MVGAGEPVGLTLVEARAMAMERLAGLRVEPEEVAPPKVATLREVWRAFQRTEFPRLADRTQRGPPAEPT